MRCPLRVSFDAQGVAYSKVYIAGEFNQWKEDDLELKDSAGDFIFKGEFDVPGLKPGRYGYKFITYLGGEKVWRTDPVNTRLKSDGDNVNSLLVVNDCRLPALSLDRVEPSSDGASATVFAKVTPGVIDGSFDPATLRAETSTGAPLPVRLDGDTAAIDVKGFAGTKVGVWLKAGGAVGDAEPLYVPVWLRNDGFSFADSTLYFAFTDRFANGAATNDAPANCLPSDSLANWLGGDFAGVRAKIEEGYFDALGVDALWLSAPNANPAGCYSGSLGRNYTAYHAYFPVSLTEVDAHFGTAEELRALVDAAHARGIRVLIDFVANHLHEESPLVSVHKEWFHPYYQCGWEQPITCWFEPYLPDLDYDRDEATTAVVDSALHWIRRYDLDGFRVDAAKHIGHPFVHNLRAEIAEKVEHRATVTAPPKTQLFYMVGETFTGGWTPEDYSQVDMIREWISPNELDGQFDFPLFYESLHVFAKQDRATASLKQFLQAQIDWGDIAQGKALMSTFVDNHDVPRFISHADNLVNGYTPMSDTSSDEAKQTGWNPSLRPQQPGRAEPYRLAELAWGLLVTQAAIPLIYYGNEVGLPGAGDPDNRRLMPWTGLTGNQDALLARYRALGKLRKAHPAFRSDVLEMSGLLDPATGANDDTLVYLKVAPSEEVLVLMDRRLDGGTDTLPIWLPERYSAGSELRDLETDEVFVTGAGRVEIPITRPNLRVLVRTK